MGSNACNSPTWTWNPTPSLNNHLLNLSLKKTYPALVAYVMHFISLLHFYEVYPSAELVFKGPSFKRKHISKLKYNPIIMTKKIEKVAQNLKRKINGAMRA